MSKGWLKFCARGKIRKRVIVTVIVNLFVGWFWRDWGWGIC